MNIQRVKVNSTGQIQVSAGKNSRELYAHQTKALKKLDKALEDKNSCPFEGLLVLPTGGGKTLIAVHCKDPMFPAQSLDKGGFIDPNTERCQVRLHQSNKIFCKSFQYNKHLAALVMGILNLVTFQFFYEVL